MTRCTTSAVGTAHRQANHVPLDTIRNVRMPSIQLKVRIVHNGIKIDATALLDSGAEGNYANTKFIEKHKIPIYDIEHPVYPRNVDGTLNQQGAIRHAAILRMEMADQHRETLEIAITNMGKHDILLGTNWLKAHNPSIDWQTSNIRLDRCPNTCTTMQPQDLQINTMEILPTLEWEMQYNDHFNAKYNSIDASQCIMTHLDKFDVHISHTTVSTNLAIKETPKTAEIPPAFQKYDKVFLDAEAQRLPKHQPWDHKIDLIPGKQM